MTSSEESLEPLRRFRLLVVKYSVGLSLAAAIPLYFWDSLAARGLLIGGFAYALGFWIIAKRLEKVALTKPDKVNFAVLTWSTFRFALYGAALFRSYTLDTETYHGLAGALAGFFIVKFVLLFLGITGMDLAKTSRAEGENS